jgi:hypothetical protein
MITNDLEFELFEKIKKIPYVKIIEKYIKEYNEDSLMVMAMQCLSINPENVQMDIVKVLEDHQFSCFALQKVQADCENALILIMQTSGMHDLIDKYNNNNLSQEDKLFIMNIFRVISLSHAHLASRNKEVRKLLGIRKGNFFR